MSHKRNLATARSEKQGKHLREKEEGEELMNLEGCNKETIATSEELRAKDQRPLTK
jgi:hypothetical protein